MMKKNILVTGSHRSGSTWTGKVIAKANKVRYVQEPFNISTHKTNSPLTYWFEFLPDSPSDHQQKVKNYIHSFYKLSHPNTLARLINIRSMQQMSNFCTDVNSRIMCRTLFKDPIAIMSAEWFYKNFQTDVVVLIRHPAAFVASLKMKDWQFDFNNFLQQPKLMNSLIEHYREDIRNFAENKPDIIDQGILLWNIIHDTIDYYRKLYEKEWYFISHEKLSMDPLIEFEKIFLKLNLKFDEKVKSYINFTAKSDENSKLTRNSVENINTWKQRLSDLEIERIKLGTDRVWKKFYCEKDWQ